MSQTTEHKIHPLVWFLLVGTFFSRAALFITLPFISIYMTTKLGVSPSLTGIIVGLGPLCGIFAAFGMGYLSDNWGRKDILKFSLFIWAFAFLGFSISNTVWQFTIFNMIYGMSRASFENVATALISDLTVTELRKRVFHLRYFAINLGACIAPPIGAWLFVQQPKASFLITGGVYFLYAILFSYFLYLHHPTKKQDVLQKKSISFAAVLNVLRKDQPLMLFLFGNILMLIGFAQIDTNLPQFLQNLHGNYGIKIFSYLTLTNAITIVLLQFPINDMVKRMNIIHVITFGFLFYGIGEMAFGFFSMQKWMLMVCMFVFTIGEILVFSNTYILIDQIGTAHLKGSYFGITEICNIGFVVGPFLGGLFLEKTSGSVMFVVMGGLSVLSILAYVLGNGILNRRTTIKVP